MSHTEQPIQLGATKKKNVVINYILQQMAVLMLAETRPDDKFTRAVQEAADKTRKRLLASHTEDELKPIMIMKDVAVGMALKLTTVESFDALNLCRHYMEELTAGRVIIMENDLDVDPDQLTLPASDNDQQ
ncbi:hypothetical protein [Spirosoma endophyticum]|uniref:Uncharacterized protein n=1 Tax=Spirosoma endophyticum TaxID=662367 RepID=A0A1I1SM73_9BACT|nr:hypothetical protein [Spirosoma endophyticum]SFD47546.1 hypothetical protein SAMN05216167_105158 [Spirosoma endophyticum]